ncbi:MAG: periplasmic heavy metal sensor [Desulfuromonadales bacterium]
MKAVFVMTMSLILTLFALQPAFADRGWSKTGPSFCNADSGMSPRLEKMALVLDLTEDQQTQIQDILKQHQATIPPLREQAKKYRATLRELMRSETFDREESLQIMQKMHITKDGTEKTCDLFAESGLTHKRHRSR